MVARGSSRPVSAEQRLKELGIKLPAPPEPFGTYAEAVRTGNLLFLTGMLPTAGREAKFIGRIGAELDVKAGRMAAYLAAINALAVARQHLGSLDEVTRIVRLGVLVATSGDVQEQPKIADGASELLQDVFGKDKNPCRLVYGVASLPLGVPVELELIFEVSA
jgi:enamine deaminase RidA (YjgF/YER057c/UK114 family)